MNFIINISLNEFIWNLEIYIWLFNLTDRTIKEVDLSYLYQIKLYKYQYYKVGKEILRFK